MAMACFDRASPALKKTLLELHSAEKPVEIDQHIHEFNAVRYHIQSSDSEPFLAHLSISTPLLSEEFSRSHGLSFDAAQMIRDIHTDDAIEIVEPAKEGYQLTLRIHLSKIPRRKESVKIIAQISTVLAVLLSSQLKEMLRTMNFTSKEQVHAVMHKPIRLVYQQREPFFVIRQPTKITAVFPMRFKEDSDVIIATAFFQELMDVGSREGWAKAPPCTWSPIPPPELRGELLEDLSTNCGFVSFDITARHIKGKKLDKMVWSLLNFHAFVKHHVKCTRGFIQRRMRKRLDNLIEILRNKGGPEEEEDEPNNEPGGCGCMRSLAGTSRSKATLERRRRSLFSNKIRYSIKVRGWVRFRHRLSKISKFSPRLRYPKLD
ncbi:hypothetical protein SAY86_012870 [Trapa natans]|uniref:Arp2/3 complex 34 kDa subunit n=1 Tax=Trapa natans TaxID=22666 RepID=A0AAN7LXF8_TRANT|nr:hypothetical protein SAY86_012870 [Trapa natans]